MPIDYSTSNADWLQFPKVGESYDFGKEHGIITEAKKVEGSKGFNFTKKGRRIDKTESCIVSLDGDTINIVDSGGVGDIITWTSVSTDDCGNTTELECVIDVVRKVKP